MAQLQLHQGELVSESASAHSEDTEAVNTLLTLESVSQDDGASTDDVLLDIGGMSISRPVSPVDSTSGMEEPEDIFSGVSDLGLGLKRAGTLQPLAAVIPAPTGKVRARLSELVVGKKTVETVTAVVSAKAKRRAKKEAKEANSSGTDTGTDTQASTRTSRSRKTVSETASDSDSSLSKSKGKTGGKHSRKSSVDSVTGESGDSAQGGVKVSPKTVPKSSTATSVSGPPGKVLTKAKPPAVAGRSHLAKAPVPTSAEDVQRAMAAKVASYTTAKLYKMMAAEKKTEREEESVKQKTALPTPIRVKPTPVGRVPKSVTVKPSPSGGAVPKRLVKKEGVTPKSPPRAPPVPKEVFKAPLPVDTVQTTTSQPPVPEDMDIDERKEDEATGGATGGVPIVEPQDSSPKGHFGDHDPVPETLRRSICAVVTDEQFDQINQMHLLTFGGLEALSELFPEWFPEKLQQGITKAEGMLKGELRISMRDPIPTILTGYEGPQATVVQQLDSDLECFSGFREVIARRSRKKSEKSQGLARRLALIASREGVDSVRAAEKSAQEDAHVAKSASVRQVLMESRDNRLMEAIVAGGS